MPPDKKRSVESIVLSGMKMTPVWLGSMLKADGPLLSPCNKRSYPRQRS